MRIGIQHSAWLTVCIELMSLCFSHIYTTKYIMEPGILICVCLISELTSQADQGTNIGFTIYQPFNLGQFSRVGSNTIYISSTSTYSIYYLIVYKQNQEKYLRQQREQKKCIASVFKDFTISLGKEETGVINNK